MWDKYYSYQQHNALHLAQNLPFRALKTLVCLLLRMITLMTEEIFASAQGYRIQKTIKAPVQFTGVGLHSGAPATLEILPASPNHGLQFEKKCGDKTYKIPAHFSSVVTTTLATSLGIDGQPDSKIATVEHLMSALYALGITNALLKLNGPEVPILDGSSSPFVNAMIDAGITPQAFTAPTLKVVKPIKLYQQGAICELLPRESLRLTTSVDFPHPMIGTQIFALELTPKAFTEIISSARTFGFYSDLQKLQSHGLALGASLENAVGFTEDGVLNENGLRFPDECVRHKLLDALGDLALCGSWIQGELVSFRGGHSIHLALLKSLEAHKSHWELLPAKPITPLTNDKANPTIKSQALKTHAPL